MHPVTPSRGVRRFGRSGAVALTALGVFAGTAAVTAPAAASTTTASVASAALSSVRVIHTSAYLTSRTPVIRAGGPAVLTGRVAYGTGPVRSKTVWLQALNRTGWRTISTTRLSRTGYAAFRPLLGGSVYLRLAFPSQAVPTGGSFHWSTSKSVLVKVTPRPAYGRGQRALAFAAKQSGKWYRYGAAGPNNFDCSGLTQYVFRGFGVGLPHKANSQKAYGRAVSRAYARPGDLVVFVRGGYGYHAGIYAGGGYMYDSPGSGRTVGKRKIWSSSVVFRRLV